jgi:Spy/CpxP family protein refolding chaperone
VNSWKVILATLIIFGTGVVTGGLLVTYSHKALKPRPKQAAVTAAAAASFPQHVAGRDAKLPPLTEPNQKKFLDRLDRELKLAPAQRARIEIILREGQERTRDLWRAEMMVARQQIRAELTPDQQVHFQALLKQRATEQRRAPSHVLSSNTAAAPISNKVEVPETP